MQEVIGSYVYQQKSCKIVCEKEEAENFFIKKRPFYEPKEGETIYVVLRHGENESNVQRTYDGRTLNLPLTPKGFGQGKAAGEKLTNKIAHIDCVITTSMQRTDQTAAEVLKSFNDDQPEFRHDDRFLERNVGKYEGGLLTDLEPTNKKDKETSASPNLGFEEKMRFTPEEGIESYASIWQRVHESVQEISPSLKNRVVLVVTHSGTIRSIYWHLAHKLGFFVPYANFKPDNGAFMILSVKDGEIDLLETDDINIS